MSGFQIEGWYYLHKNGDLIYEPDHPGLAAYIRENTSTVALWPFSPARKVIWGILVEALASGANQDRVKGLAARWGCDNDDAYAYANAVGALLSIDGDKFMATRLDFINIQESPVGFGDTALEAFAELAKELGYVPRKMWGNTFEGVMKAEDKS